MTQPDDWIETLRRKEKADEDRYFAEQDRKRIETLQCRRQPTQAARLHETAVEAPADQALRESAES